MKSAQEKLQEKLSRREQKETEDKVKCKVQNTKRTETKKDRTLSVNFENGRPDAREALVFSSIFAAKAERLEEGLALFQSRRRHRRRRR